MVIPYVVMAYVVMAYVVIAYVAMALVVALYDYGLKAKTWKRHPV